MPPAAGDIIYASDFPYSVASFTSALNSSAIGTSETVVATLPSATYKAGCAYRIKVTGGITMSTTTGFAAWNLRKGSTVAGAVLIAWPRTPVLGMTSTSDIGLSDRYFIVGATDVTTALCLSTLASSGATVTHTAASAHPRGLDALFDGPASKWPNAVVLS